MFGERLNTLRRMQGITARDMADKLDMAERSYRFYESGKRSPSLDTLVKIADILNTSTDLLLGRDEYLKSLGAYVDE